jgi:hypothetical protein
MSGTFSGARARPAGRWRRYVLLAACATATLLGASSALANVNGAGFTTDDPAGPLGYNGACQNGNPSHTTPAVDCNIYLAKKDVWINGGPDTGKNHLTDGTYFFAVLVPGGQPDPNDGGAKNLSDTVCDPYSGCPGPTNTSDGSTIPIGDPVTSREFTVSGGKIANYLGGGHQVDDQYNDPSGPLADPPIPYLGKLINLWPYDDTTNNGGVYILAICQISSSQLTQSITPGAPVAPQDCKYDAFKVQVGECTTDCGPPPAADLFGSKTATPNFTREFNWTITKSVDNCQVTLAHPNGCGDVSSPQTLNYTIVVMKDSGHDSGWLVKGNITVTNPAQGDASKVKVSDSVLSGPDCTVSPDTVNGLDPVLGGTLLAGDTAIYPYECDFASDPGTGTWTNEATVSWDPVLSDGSTTTNSSFTADRTFAFSSPTTTIHDCVNVSATAVVTATGSASAALKAGNSRPNEQICASKTYTYAVILTITNGCVTVDNTAAFAVTDKEDTNGDTDDTGSSEVVTHACGPVAGALTMGFWQNKNGQAIITGQAKTGACPSATWLRQYNPFQDLSATATCSAVGTYVYNVIKAANCAVAINYGGYKGSYCNAMLKAQMLATALDVYFSDPALGGNKINAPTPIGGIHVDLTHICKMIDGSGGSTCSGSYEDASPAFSSTCETVSQMLTDAASHAAAASAANPYAVAWYGQVKATQVLAKDAFDSINNSVAYAC